jgi:IMP dehydrogenase
MMGQPVASSLGSAGQRLSLGHGHQFGGIAARHAHQSGTKRPLEKILLGPATKDDGTMNFVGALRLGMGTCGVLTIREMQQAELLYAPALQTEGKRQQFDQHVGQGK